MSSLSHSSSASYADSKYVSNSGHMFLSTHARMRSHNEEEIETVHVEHFRRSQSSKMTFMSWIKRPSAPSSSDKRRRPTSPHKSYGSTHTTFKNEIRWLLSSTQSQSACSATRTVIKEYTTSSSTARMRLQLEAKRTAARGQSILLVMSRTRCSERKSKDPTLGDGGDEGTGRAAIKNKLLLAASRRSCRVKNRRENRPALPRRTHTHSAPRAARTGWRAHATRTRSAFRAGIPSVDAVEHA